jgi:hypothetical protein
MGQWCQVAVEDRKKTVRVCGSVFCVCVGNRMKPTTKKKIIPITKKEPWFLKKEMGAYPMRWCASSNMTSSSAVHASLLTLGSK